MSKFGINVPDGAAAQSIDGVVKAAESMKDEAGEVRAALLLVHGSDRSRPKQQQLGAVGVRPLSSGLPRFTHQAVCVKAEEPSDRGISAVHGAVQVVLKSQIYAGGRGLGTFKNGLKGGVHMVKADEVRDLAQQMLGQTLVTKQTGEAGAPCTMAHAA